MLLHRLSFLYLYKGGVDKMNISGLTILISSVHLLFFICIPLYFVMNIYNIECNIKDNKTLKKVDLIVFSVIAFLCFCFLIFKSSAFAGLSSYNGFNYIVLFVYRAFVGLVCSCLYSFLICFSLMQKYLKKLKLFKYRWLLFFIILVIELFVVYHFIDLCHTWVW